MRSSLLVLVVVAIAGCSSAGQEVDDPLRIDLAEFSLDVSGSVGPGPVSIPVGNVGEFGHTLVVSDADGRVVASTPVLEPGEDAVLDVDLDAGTYQFTCRIVVELPDGRIVDHYAEGMAATVEVAEP